RGVMEKCTYCVQRITRARITAEQENRPIRDGEIVTACQAVCPTNAIVFGNVNDPNSRVSQLKASDRNYALLAELGTRPRTTYLGAAHTRNPGLRRGESRPGSGGFQPVRDAGARSAEILPGRAVPTGAGWKPALPGGEGCPPPSSAARRSRSRTSRSCMDS